MRKRKEGTMRANNLRKINLVYRYILSDLGRVLLASAKSSGVDERLSQVGRLRG